MQYCTHDEHSRLNDRSPVFFFNQKKLMFLFFSCSSLSATSGTYRFTWRSPQMVTKEPRVINLISCVENKFKTGLPLAGGHPNPHEGKVTWGGRDP